MIIIIGDDKPKSMVVKIHIILKRLNLFSTSTIMHNAQVAEPLFQKKKKSCRTSAYGYGYSNNIYPSILTKYW
jgi:hypothetical protein